MITMIMLMLELSSKAVTPVTNSDYLMMTRMLKLSVTVLHVSSRL